MADYEIEMTTRYRDSDAMGHVNHAVYSSFMEHAATSFVAELLDVPVDDVPMAIVHLELDFERQIEIGDEVTSAVAIAEIGDRSLTFEHELRVDGARAASATAVRVAMDGDRDDAIPVPDEWRDRLAAYRDS